MLRTGSGADHDAYSSKWHGLAQANPEQTPAALEKVLRWAIFTQSTEQPMLTSLMLPYEPSNATSYTRWLSHPLVQEIRTVGKEQLQLQQQNFWSQGHNSAYHAKWGARFIVAANTAGLLLYVNCRALQQTLEAATMNMRGARPAMQPAHINSSSVANLQGLDPRKHFTGAPSADPERWTTHKRR